MHIIQSRLTCYVNPTSYGDGREYSVPVKGTKYSAGFTNLRDISHGNDQLDKAAALFCGNNFYATRVAQLMGQGCPVSHVQKVAEEGRAAYEAAIQKALERDELKRGIFAKYGGWQKSYLANTAKWREMIEAFKEQGFWEEAEKQELGLARELSDCYGPEGERPSKFRLVDINQYYYNCGHYPTFVIRAVPSGGFETYAEAQAAASVANEKSHRSWIQFLNG
jgi:hypothetical protein